MADGILKWLDGGPAEPAPPLTADVLDQAFAAIRKRGYEQLFYAHSDAEEAALVERYGRAAVVRALTLNDLTREDQ